MISAAIRTPLLVVAVRCLIALTFRLFQDSHGSSRSYHSLKSDFAISRQVKPPISLSKFRQNSRTFGKASKTPVISSIFVLPYTNPSASTHPMTTPQVSPLSAIPPGNGVRAFKIAPSSLRDIIVWLSCNNKMVYFLFCRFRHCPQRPPQRT